VIGSPEFARAREEAEQWIAARVAALLGEARA
jgi:hypothetical protein